MGLIDKEYPSEIIVDVHKRLEDTQENSEVGYFAGEFFDEDELKRSVRTAKTRPIFLIEIEDIEQLEDGNSADMRTPKDRITINVYCAVSNRQSEPLQQREAINLANEARRQLTGKKLPQADHRNRGFYKFLGIQKEFTIVGLSVYRLSMYVDVHVDLDKVFIPAAFQGVLEGTFGKLTINLNTSKVDNKIIENINNLVIDISPNIVLSEQFANINPSMLQEVVQTLSVQSIFDPFRTEKVVGFWDFVTDSSGQTLTDHSGNNNDGIAGLDTDVGSDDPTPNSDGWAFDGGDLVSFPSEFVLDGNNNEFSIVIGFTPSSTSGRVLTGFKDGTNSWYIIISSSTTIGVRFGAESAKTYTIPNLTIGNTYVVAIRMDAANNVELKFYGGTWDSKTTTNPPFKFDAIGARGTLSPDFNYFGDIDSFFVSEEYDDADTIITETVSLLEDRGLTVSQLS